jgi:hypothetical protein
MALSQLAEGDVFYVSGTFWLTAVLTVLTIALLALAGWQIYLNRQRKLRWERSSAPLLRTDGRLPGSLQVSWDGQPVTRPSVATFKLTNTSRRDVGSNAFDGNRSITVDFQDRVLVLLEPLTTATNDLLPVQLNGNIVMVGPGLLRRGQSVTVAALIEGTRAPEPQFPLIEIKVSESDEAGAAAQQSKLAAATGLISALFGVAAAIVTAIFAAKGS